jgi:ABC-2 type transport system ATP-binding protein
VSGPLVVLRDLRKQYGKRIALAGIDLTITERQIVGVVGPDGAGKTTLLRSIAGLLEVEATTARVLGHDLLGDVTELKAHMGYVPQVFSLHRDLTVGENLRFTARLHRLPPDEGWARAEALLKRIAMDRFADRPAGALSGGKKQKLAIATALLPRPDLIVLDEPTAGVDVVARGEIWDLLIEASRGALVVQSTSYLDEAERCDRLVYLDDGRVVAAGTPDELRRRVEVELYRVWSDTARAVASTARALPYVAGARATGRYARVEVPAAKSPGTDAVLRDLGRLAHDGPHFAERIPVDMETTLLALAGGIA